MFTRLLLFVGASLAVPLPQQLTEDQFLASPRNLKEVPSVRISKSYASVRKQGEGASGALVNFPTLLVRDPNELTPDLDQKFPSSVGPVYRPKDISKIEEEIRKINEAEIEAIEEKDELNEIEDDEEEEAIEELTDIIAEEIVAEELEKFDDITDLAAIEIVAEEVMDEILEDAELEELGMDIPDDAENEIVEGSGLPQIDFGSITEVTY